MTDIELVGYYVNLLILQYKGKPKAEAEITSIISQMVIFELIEAVRNGYDIDTAIGVQLDVLGKYLGLSREAFIASDFDYRFYLKFKLVQIYSNYSPKEIDDLLFEFFPGEIFLTDNYDMTINYDFIDPDITQINFLIDNKLIPKPAGVGYQLIGFTTGYFGFFGDPNALGFNYLVQAGESLLVNFGSGVEELDVDFGSGVETLDVAFTDDPIPADEGGAYSYLLK